MIWLADETERIVRASLTRPCVADGEDDLDRLALDRHYAEIDDLFTKEPTWLHTAPLPSTSCSSS